MIAKDALQASRARGWESPVAVRWLPAEHWEMLEDGTVVIFDGVPGHVLHAGDPAIGEHDDWIPAT